MISRMRSPRSASGASFAMMRGFVVTPESTPQAKRSLISLGSELSTKRAMNYSSQNSVKSSTRGSPVEDDRVGEVREGGPVRVRPQALRAASQGAEFATVRHEDEPGLHAGGLSGRDVALAVSDHPRARPGGPELLDEGGDHPRPRLSALARAHEGRVPARAAFGVVHAHLDGGDPHAAAREH